VPVLRTCGDAGSYPGKPPGDHAGIVELGDANREIEAFIDDIDVPVIELDIEFDLRMQCDEVVDRGP
jgi:hypothetical protein